MSLVDNIKQMETKQKVILIVTIIAFIYVLYLGYDTFFAANSSVAPPPSAPAMPSESSAISTEMPRAEEPAENAAHTPASEPASTPATPPASEVTPQDSTQIPNTGGRSQPRKSVQPHAKVVEVKPLEPTPEQMALLAESQEMQREYLRLVSQYQIAQLQERLEEANASIAAAKLKSAITASETQKLNDELKARTLRGLAPPSTGEKGPADFASTLQLMYIGKMKGKWMAMLNANGSYYEVKQGTRLPDGSMVSNIDTKGIVITKDNSKRFIPMPKSLD